MKTSKRSRNLWKVGLTLMMKRNGIRRASVARIQIATHRKNKYQIIRLKAKSKEAPKDTKALNRS